MSDIIDRIAPARHAFAAVLMTAALLVAPRRLARRLSRAHDHVDRAVSGRRPDRHHRAHRLGRLQQVARPVRDRRQPHRRRRQSRHRHGGARHARRLHAAAHLDRDRRQPGALQQSALRSDQGFRADLRAGQRPQCRVRALGFRHQDARGPDRACEGGARRAQLFEPGRRHQVASRRRAAQAARRHRHGAYSLSRRRPRRPWRCWKAPCRSARWRSRRSSR